MQSPEKAQRLAFTGMINQYTCSWRLGGKKALQVTDARILPYRLGIASRIAQDLLQRRSHVRRGAYDDDPFAHGLSGSQARWVGGGSWPLGGRPSLRIAEDLRKLLDGLCWSRIQSPDTSSNVASTAVSVAICLKPYLPTEVPTRPLACGRASIHS